MSPAWPRCKALPPRDTFGWPYQIQRLATLFLTIAPPVVLCCFGSTATEVSSVTRSEVVLLTALLVLGGASFCGWPHGRPR
jgi:hypothetical protein